MSEVKEYDSEEEPVWEEQQVSVPMSKEDYDESATNLKTVLQELTDATLEKKEASESYKKIESKRDAIVSQLASKKKLQTLPSQWQFDWDKGEKRLIAELSDRSIYEVTRIEITESDKQVHMTEPKAEAVFESEEAAVESAEEDDTESEAEDAIESEDDTESEEEPEASDEEELVVVSEEAPHVA